MKCRAFLPADCCTAGFGLHCGIESNLVPQRPGLDTTQNIRPFTTHGVCARERTRARVERAREEMRDQETLAAYSQNLRKIGFYSADNSTVVSVAALFNAGIFGKGAVLVGTHAFGVLLNELGVSASPFPLTEDVDVARAQRIEIAALPESGLLALLKQTGLPFHEVPGLKRGEPSTSFKVRGRKLKIDLLVSGKRIPYRAIRIPELGAYATALPYLAYLLGDPVMSILIGRDRLVPVAVPHAGRFLIHKLAVSTLRAASDSPKREKDIVQSATLAAILAQEQDFVLQEAIDAMNMPLRNRVKPAVKRALKFASGGLSSRGSAARKTGVIVDPKPITFHNTMRVKLLYGAMEIRVSS